ncbi:MAG: DUF1566 domain-containing protein [Candidatus Planktophila sp.]
MVHSNNDFQDSYHDDPADNRRNRGGSKGISGLLALVLTIFGAGFYLQTTLAPNVSINSGGALEFGQGSARTVACSEEQSLIITPLSSFTNSAGAGSYKFSSIKVTNIPTACRGQDFIFSAYNNVASSAAQAIFNTSSTRAVVYMKDDDTFEVGIGGTGLSVATNSASSFTVTFTAPVVTSSAVFNLTVESAVHTHVPTCAEGGDCVVGDTGPGGGIVYYVADTSFSCGPTLNLSCNYLEVAPSGWDTRSDPEKVWAVSAYHGIDVTEITNQASSDDPNTTAGIGPGYKNSAAIVAQNGIYNASSNNYAAGAARAYTGGSRSDWYLPTTAELNLLCQWARNVTQDVSIKCALGTLNTGTAASGGFGANGYWSSSEANSGRAWFQNFNFGTQTNYIKSSTYYVRPVRAF